MKPIEPFPCSFYLIMEAATKVEIISSFAMTWSNIQDSVSMKDFSSEPMTIWPNENISIELKSRLSWDDGKTVAWVILVQIHFVRTIQSQWLSKTKFSFFFMSYVYYRSADALLYVVFIPRPRLMDQPELYILDIIADRKESPQYHCIVIETLRNNKHYIYSNFIGQCSSHSHT